jgi:predicted RNA-binding Zn-ribbon protein involved in translation (DUF1610 family)
MATRTEADQRFFPCPLCGETRDLRETKKKKPYLVCDSCGVQLFVRNETGIGRVEQLLKDGEKGNVWERMEELKRSYQKKCPKCGKQFWLSPDLISTDWLDDSFEGFRCPDRKCKGIVKWEKTSRGS